MRQAEPNDGESNVTCFSDNLSALSWDITENEATTLWREWQDDNKLDLIFEVIQNKIQYLWQKIKDGSATSQEYLRAALLAKFTDLGDTKAFHYGMNTECQSNDCLSPTSMEDQCAAFSSESATGDAIPEPECNTRPSSVPKETNRFKAHLCGPSCLLDINPNFSKNNNPLKFPLLCRFQRRHAKTNCISRPLDVTYKAPCGKSLRSFKEVRSYLFETQCHFLFLDCFSFNTYLQLDRNSFNRSNFLAEDFDISKDAESIPVSFCNEIDSTRPSNFKYRKSSWPHGYSINNFTDIFVDCCNCTDGCVDISKCACLQLTAKAYHENAEMAKDAKTLGYKYKRLRSPLPTGLYECNLTCKCDPKMCQNRVVQHGIQVRLQVFKTKSKGWGVRCLDDVDSGTFVCTYAGRIFVRSFDTESNKMAIGSTFDNDEGNQATGASSIPVNRKRHVSHSDSEIILMHSTPCTNPKSFSSSQTEIKRVKKDASKERLSDSVPIKRPKTRTAVLQKLRRQLIEEGSCILQNSSDDEDLVSPSAGKVIHTDECEADNVVRVAETTTNTSEKAVGYISDDSNTSMLSDICPLETSSCEPKDESSKATVCLLASEAPFSEENEYYLDASKEGNVGRFLNHSCSPNLFIQHVYVETHHKQFPWVAFFTNRHVRAGDELTWECNYEIGTFPDQEIPCMCEHKTCRNITI
ncbi:histone-lysine N-methyltransferase SETDB2 isoform X1 [Pelobates fuscus]|uniref:histone-lysine N-methyltransferase SETDB2 isoform X1 n=1 Tax=Pelobates fuscus TaxID=191477 RepID=UPI002FE4C272